MNYLKLIAVLILLSCQEKSLIIDENNGSIEIKNGVLFYENKKFSGNLVGFYNDSKIKKNETLYSNGLKHGLENYWYISGTIASIRWYSKGVKINEHIGYWENGNPKYKYFFNQKGEYNGSVKEWFLSGAIYKIFNYVNGKESGSQKLWRNDGSIRANYFVVNGERFGLIGLKKCEGVSYLELKNN